MELLQTTVNLVATSCFVPALTSTSSLCSILMPMVSLELMDTISSPDAERKIRPSVRHPDTLQNIR